MVQPSFDLFNNLATHAMPSDAFAIFSGGYSTLGIGLGTYVADSIATSSLASTYPLFCKADSTGRYFRLVPQDGVIAISQGGALGGANNDQPAVQAAINYVKFIGCRTLLFDFDTVSLWCPVRTSNAAQTANGSTVDEWSLDGMSIVVTAPVKFLGLPNMTHIKLLSTTGGSLETGWQNVGGNIWRGPGIRLMGGTQSSPSSYNLTFFGMENIWLDSGCSYTGSRNTNITPSSPDGPDYTNRGLQLQDTECDAISLVNVKISGFKAEAYFVAGTGTTNQYLRRLEVWGSNQCAFNPAFGIVDAAECYFHDSFLGTESLGRAGGKWVACTIANTVTNTLTGGPANGLEYNYAYPTRDLTKTPPWLDLIDCNFENAGQIIVGNYIRMTRNRITDTPFYMVTGTAMAGGNGALTSTYIDIDYTVDLISMFPIFAIYGPPNLTTVIPGAPAGTYIVPPNDVHINVNVHRTANAIANGRSASVASVTGCLDSNSCSINIGEADGLANIVTAATAVNMPLVTISGPSSSQLIGSTSPWAELTLNMATGPYSLAPVGPRSALAKTGAAAAIAVTMASTYTYANGQRHRIWWSAQGTSGTTYTFAHNGTGLRLNSDCVLAVKGDWLEVEYASETGLWHECGRSIHAA